MDPVNIDLVDAMRAETKKDITPYAVDYLAWKIYRLIEISVGYAEAHASMRESPIIDEQDFETLFIEGLLKL